MAPAIFAALVVTAIAGCEQRTGATKEPPPGSKPVQIVAVPDGATDGPALIRAESERAAAEGRKLLVYVGATWCEPCQHFHDAAAAGKLDADLPNLTLLEFDHDRHGALLDATNCRSKMIPLFVEPTPEGMCGARRVEGGIKGSGAVGFLTPKVQSLLR